LGREKVDEQQALATEPGVGDGTEGTHFETEADGAKDAAAFVKTNGGAGKAKTAGQRVQKRCAKDVATWLGHCDPRRTRDLSIRLPGGYAP